MPKRDRDTEDSQESNNGAVTIKKEVVSPRGTAPSATTTSTASASTNNMGDRTKDVEELKGMLRTSMDQHAEAESTIEKMKKDVEAKNEELEKIQNKLHIRCTQQLFARISTTSTKNEPHPRAYPCPKLLESVREGKIDLDMLDCESSPPGLGGEFKIQPVHLTKCSELVEVFKNGLSPKHKLEKEIDPDARIVVFVLTLGNLRGQVVTNGKKDDFIILGAASRFYSKPLAEFIYEKEWPELTNELWGDDPCPQECKLCVDVDVALPEFIRDGISTKPYNAVVKDVHIPKADNRQEATECEIDLDRMVVVDVVTKAERDLTWNFA